MNVTIRPASADDYTAAQALVRQLHEQNRAVRPDLYADTPDVLTLQHYRYLTSAGQAIVAETGGKVTGWAVAAFRSYNMASLQPRTSLFIESFAVDEAADEDAVGHAMLDSITAFAKQQGCDALELNVDLGNERNRRIFGHYGFRIKALELEYPLPHVDSYTMDGADLP